MTPTNLVREVAAEIRRALVNERMPAEYQNAPEYLSVNVFEGYLPKDLFEETSYFPMVMVELVELRDNLRGGSEGTIALSIGTFAKEDNAWQDNFHLMEVIRRRLLEKRVLAKKFKLLDEIVWRTEPNQPLPFFFSYGELTYSLFLTQERTVI